MALCIYPVALLALLYSSCPLQTLISQIQSLHRQQYNVENGKKGFIDGLGGVNWGTPVVAAHLVKPLMKASCLVYQIPIVAIEHLAPPVENRPKDQQALSALERL